VKKWIAILSGLLVVQLVLAMVVNLTGRDYGAFQPQEKLLAFDPKTVDDLRIADGENSLELRRREGRWRLPASGDFPADQPAVDGLLDKLAGLQKGWPVATTAGAAKRFKVGNGSFERKLTLLAKDQPQAVLYVGTSPGFRKVYVRPEGEDAVYAVAFNTWEANAKPEDWIDKGILTLDQSKVTRVEMPGFVLERDGEALKLTGLGEGEEIKQDDARAFLREVTGLRIESLLGTEAKPEYQQDEPALELTVVRKDGDELSYRFSKPKDGTYYVLKRSDLDEYFKVAGFTVDPIKDTKREKLVRARTEEDTNKATADAPRKEATEATSG
jgi:hypothetical protein